MHPFQNYFWAMDTLLFCMVRKFKNRIIFSNCLVKTWSQIQKPSMDTLWTTMDNVYLLWTTMDTFGNWPRKFIKVQ